MIIYQKERSERILEGITKEREFQKEKWGRIDKTIGDWLLVTKLELDEAIHAHCKNVLLPGRSSRVAELIQVAACAISALHKIPAHELEATIAYIYGEKSLGDLEEEIKLLKESMT